jgi:hypothetical protein
MSDQSAVDNDEVLTAEEPQQLIAKKVQFASAIVTPFAAAVAEELETFGLNKQKIEEIMLRSAQRFEAMDSESAQLGTLNGPAADEKSGDVLDWFKTAAGQAYDYVSSVVSKHGPAVAEAVTPIVTAALEKALYNFLNSAMKAAKSKR